MNENIIQTEVSILKEKKNLQWEKNNVNGRDNLFKKRAFKGILRDLRNQKK